MLKTNEKSLNKEIQNIKNNQMKILELKNKITRIKKTFLDGLHDRIDRT